MVVDEPDVDEPDEPEEPDDEPEEEPDELEPEPLAAGSVGGSSTMKPRWLVWSPVRLKSNVFGDVIWITSGVSGDTVTVPTLGDARAERRGERPVELLGDVALAEEQRLRRGLALLRRHEDDDLVHRPEVAERVQRELERLAAQEQAALLGRLAAVDRARRAEAAEVVDDALVVEDLDAAALRGILAHGDGERDALDLEAGHADVHDLAAVGQLVLRPDVLGDLLRARGAAGGRRPRRPVLHAIVAAAARNRDEHREPRERRQADRDERAGQEVEAWRVRRVLRGRDVAEVAGAPARREEIAPLGLALVDDVGIHDVVDDRVRRQQRFRVVARLRAGRVLRVPSLRDVLQVTHSLGQMLSSRTSMTGASSSDSRSSSTTSSP